MSMFIDPYEIIKQGGFGAQAQLLFLLFAYGYILSKSSALISDGSELLLLIPSLAGIVGSVVLPVLGAVPDGAIVLFSGFGPDLNDVQKQLSVGVGALAGSTIMLLTIPWALCIITGRVNIVAGEAHYKTKPAVRLTNGFSLFRTGVTPRASIKTNGIIMIGTTAAYFIIQGAAFYSHCDLNDNKGCKGSGEHWWALAALLVCIGAFVGYLYYNIKHADDEDKEDVIAEVRKQAIESHIMSLSVAFESELKDASPNSHLLSHEEADKRLNSALKAFFHKYDKNGNGVIDPYELRFLLKDVGENMDDAKFDKLLKEIDSDGSGSISFPEFAVAMRGFLKSKGDYAQTNPHPVPNSPYFVGNTQEQTLDRIEKGSTKAEEADDEEEEEEIPEDLADLPPAKQKTRILMRSAWMMGLGTAVVLFFSDPMVDVLGALGESWNIGGFYVAFVLAPIASNASELIASIAYAQKKTKKTITISLSALEGAACMNNTFCLAIFLCLIFGRGLAWEFSAETIAIVLVELALFFYAFFKTTYVVFDSFFIFSLYPISIFLVWFLENIAGLN